MSLYPAPEDSGFYGHMDKKEPAKPLSGQLNNLSSMSFTCSLDCIPEVASTNFPFL